MKLFFSCFFFPTDCQDYYERGYSTSGIFTLSPDGYSSYEAWCDFDHNHGWTVIARRQDGSVDFQQNWAECKKGFGDLSNEHWLGKWSDEQELIIITHWLYTRFILLYVKSLFQFFYSFWGDVSLLLCWQQAQEHFDIKLSFCHIQVLSLKIE